MMAPDTGSTAKLGQEANPGVPAAAQQDQLGVLGRKFDPQHSG